jgi:hypothetical protein
MEIECMEAEAREFRAELWDLASGEAAGKPVRPSRDALFLCLRVSVLAAFFVMAVGLPLSMDQERPQGFYGDAVTLVTSTENDILQALRESLSSQNRGRVVLSIEFPESAPDLLEIGAASASEPGLARPLVRAVRLPEIEPEERPPAPDSEEKTEEPAAGPSVDEVISLIQVGQRALRVSEPAVKVIPAP